MKHNSPPKGHTDPQVVIEMSLIGCTSDCLYQKDGYCHLKRAMSSGQPSPEHPCVNYVPVTSQNGGQGLADIADPDEL